MPGGRRGDSPIPEGSRPYSYPHTYTWGSAPAATLGPATRP